MVSLRLRRFNAAFYLVVPRLRVLRPKTARVFAEPSSGGARDIRFTSIAVIEYTIGSRRSVSGEEAYELKRRELDCDTL